MRIFNLPKTPQDFFSAAAERFDSLDVKATLELFDEDSIFVDAAGSVHKGKEAVGIQLGMFFSMASVFKSTNLHLFVSGSTALLISHWMCEGKAPSGEIISLNGTASDVIQCGKDGVWRYAIDNPFGTLHRQSLTLDSNQR